jgi:hypothetical protein
MWNEDLDRLLALAAPTAGPAAKAGTPARPGARHAEPDAARLLRRAVERVSDRAHHASSASALSDPPSPARSRTVDSIESGPPHVDTGARFTEAATSPGGFRGLALRALGTTGGTRHHPVLLEPEPRPAPEARLDDLDARVTESLARVLEHEARRHGIDVAGARA